MQAVTAGQVIMIDATSETRHGAPRMAVVVPLHDRGAFVLEIDPAVFLFAYLETGRGTAEQGSAYCSGAKAIPSRTSTRGGGSRRFRY